MRILLVTSRLPFPPGWGAATRDYQLARHLAARHAVTMLCYARPDEAAAVEQLRGELEDVRVVPLPMSGPVTRRARQLGALASPTPFALREEAGPAMQAEIDRLTSCGRFDVIQVESVRMLGMQYPRSVPAVLDEHNIEYELLGRMMRAESSWARRAFNAVEFTKLQRAERRAWEAVDACAVTSEREEAIVRRHAPATPCVTAPNGVDTTYFHPYDRRSEPDTLVFTGLLSYRPNWDAAHYLVQDILPRVRRWRPGCTLTIVGMGDDGLRHLAAPGVHFTGFVPDLRPYLARASVVVAPLRIGGGTRLKILEAFAMGKAVVSTTLGSEGIRARHGEHLLIGDSADDIARLVVEVLKQPRQGQRLGAAAARLVSEHYSWRSSAERLDGLYERVAGRSAARR